MDNRTLLIIGALLAPIVILAILAWPAQQAPERPPATKEKTTPAPTPTEKKAYPGHVISLEEAKRRIQKEMDRLNSLTEEEWNKEQKQRLEKRKPRKRRRPPPPKE